MAGELYTIGEVREVVSFLTVLSLRPKPPRGVQEIALSRIKSKELKALAMAAQTTITMHNSIGLEGMATVAQGLKNIMGITDEDIEADLRAQDEETRNKNNKGPEDLLKDIFNRSQN